MHNEPFQIISQKTVVGCPVKCMFHMGEKNWELDSQHALLQHSKGSHVDFKHVVNLKAQTILQIHHHFCENVLSSTASATGRPSYSRDASSFRRNATRNATAGQFTNGAASTAAISWASGLPSASYSSAWRSR